MTATILKLDRPPAAAPLVCSSCGASGTGSCHCGVAYVPAAQRAADALAQDPSRSDRAIATEIGVSDKTVAKARRSTAESSAVAKRVGKDGKARKMPISASEEPQKPNRRQEIKIPAGARLSELCRNGLELEQTGTSIVQVAKQIGISVKNYRQGRAIIQLIDRTDLNTSERMTVERACKMMDDNKHTIAAFNLVRPITDQVWGRGRVPRDDRRAQKRVESFKTALAIILQACTHGGDIDVPRLTAEDTRSALEQVNEAAAALRALTAKIRRTEA